MVAIQAIRTISVRDDSYPIRVCHIDLRGLEAAAAKSEDDSIIYHLMRAFSAKGDWNDVSLSELQAAGVTSIYLTLASLDDCGWVIEVDPDTYRPTHEFISHVFANWPAL